MTARQAISATNTPDSGRAGTVNGATEIDRLTVAYEGALKALQVANGRNIKGERAQARKDLALTVARLAAAMPAQGKAA